MLTSMERMQMLLPGARSNNTSIISSLISQVRRHDSCTGVMTDDSLCIMILCNRRRPFPLPHEILDLVNALGFTKARCCVTTHGPYQGGAHVNVTRSPQVKKPSLPRGFMMWMRVLRSSWFSVTIRARRSILKDWQ